VDPSIVKPANLAPATVPVDVKIPTIPSERRDDVGEGLNTRLDPGEERKVL
jgi:hypothetical protein